MIHTLRTSLAALLLATFVPLSISFAREPEKTGRLSGTVVATATHQPIPGAVITLLNTKLGASSDTTGHFVLDGIPVGTYAARVSCVGFRPSTSTDIAISTGHPVQLAVQLEEEPIELQGDVTVTGSLFTRPREIVVNRYAMSYEEIRRAPGGIGDISRVMQAMPGIVPTSDQRNDLVVRGGSPAENLTIVDNMEIPNLSHFGAQGATGGPISMLNTEFVREASFLAGGFPAMYGNKLSSVLNVGLREGNRENLSGMFDLGFAGAGFIMEGGLGEHGSWMVAARRSYLDLLAGNYGLTAIPKYSNYQAKATYDLAPSHKLWFVSLGGIDKIVFVYDPKETKEPSSLAVNSGGWRAISGLNWQWLWGSTGYGTLGISDALEGFEQDARDNDLNMMTVFENKSRDRQTTVKYDAVLNTGTAGQLTAGVAARFIESRLLIGQPVGMSNAWEPTDRRIDTLNLNETQRFTQSSAYLQWTVSPVEALSLTAGLRYDDFGITAGAQRWSPRLGLKYEISPSVELHAATGIYYQTAPLVFVLGIPSNRNLSPIRADHYTAGVAFYPADDLKFSVEGYIKRYAEYPVSREHTAITMANAGDQYTIAGFLFPLSSQGTGETRGIELYMQKKLADQLYAQISYSYSQAQYTALDGVSRPGSFDVPHLVSITGGYRFNSSWEFSSRFTYATGRPYTPLNEAASRLYNRTVYDFTRANAVRRPDYHRLDIRMDYRAHFDGWNLVTYFEVQNVYARENLFMYLWNEKTHEQMAMNQIGFFPFGGVKIEF
jgi:hypothetical protein